MNLVQDKNIAASCVDVPCIVCGKMHRLNTSFIDTDGPAFRAYYCSQGCLSETFHNEMETDLID